MEGEREGEKHQCVVASHTPPTGDLAHNPGMCPDWESNPRSFGSQAGTQSTEPHQPELCVCVGGGFNCFFQNCYFPSMSLLHLSLHLISSFLYFCLKNTFSDLF